MDLNRTNRRTSATAAETSEHPYEMLLHMWKRRHLAVLNEATDSSQRREMIRDIYEFLHAQQLCNTNARLDRLEKLLVQAQAQAQAQEQNQAQAQEQNSRSWSWKCFLLGGSVGVAVAVGFGFAARQDGV